jgi:hypothetical protein
MRSPSLRALSPFFLASGAHVKLFGAADAKPSFELAFPWRITLGTLVTVVVACCFRTPDARIASRAAVDATHA